MSSPTDQQLVQFIGQGRREALAQLFERYSADLYDYLARLAGDRDQAARLLDTVFMRVPGAAPGFNARDSVRGGLYSLAREAGLDWLRQRGWLDGLPPSDEAIAPGLQGDVWKAARAMPAFFRAVLITEELQPLSPTEKARALGVNRTDLARLIEEARRSFNRIYDAQARSEGRPTSEQINPDTVWNARRRLPVEGGSLFGFLPLIPLPDSLKDQIRRHVVDAMSPPPVRPVQLEQQDNSGAAAAALGTAAAGAVAASMLNSGTPVPQPQPQTQLPPPVQQPPVTETQVPPRAPTVSEYTETVTEERTSVLGGLAALPTTAIAALIGVALALLICTGVFLLTQNRGKPSITNVQPPENSTVQQTPQMNVFAVYQSDRELDRAKSVLQIDGQIRPPTFVENTIAWTGSLEAGSHVAFISITDSSGNNAEKTWTFTVLAANASITPIVPQSTGTVTVTPFVTVTPIVPNTSEIVTVTPIIMTQTPPFFASATFPVQPTIAPGVTATPCIAGVAGVVFNDLNRNSIRDPNEPGLANVGLTLLTQSNSFVSSTVSDTFGNYLFGNVQLGFYRIQAQTPAGWSPTSSGTLSVNLLGCGTVNNFNFGFAQTPTGVPTSLPSVTPSSTVPPPFSVTNASAFVTPQFSTTCPQTFTFNGSITANAAGVVNYQWMRNDGSVGPVQTLNFLFAGTQNVMPDSLTLGSPGFSYSGWQRVQVLSPNSLASPLASFTLNCASPTTPAPTNTPLPTGTSAPTNTPTATTAPFSVTGALAQVTPASSTSCNETLTFNGSISATGSGIVKYQWVQSNGQTGPEQTITFFGAGTQNVSPYTWTVNLSPPMNLNGSGKIKVLLPNSAESNEATYAVNCLPSTLTPTDTPSPTP